MKRLRAGLIIIVCIGCFCSVRAQKEEKDDQVRVLPVLLRGPYLQAATPHSIVIRWRTDASCRSRVQYGSAPNALNQFINDSALVNEHKIKLDGLKPYTKYYYSIGAIRGTLQGDSSNYFYTLPEPGTAGLYRVAAFGDCGNNSVNQYAVRDAIVSYLGKNYLNAWLLLGDNTYPDGTDAEFQMNFFHVYKDELLKKYPLFPSPGNHDYHDKEFSAAVAQQTHEIAYYQNFTMPVNGESGGVPSNTPSYYSFDLGNIHFLSLDSYGKMDDQRLYDTLGPQVSWIKKDLAAAINSEWIVAYWHHPPFSKGSHDSDKEDELVKIRTNFIRILERYGVDLVLCGHSHDYERSGPMKGYYGTSAQFDSVRNRADRSAKNVKGSANKAFYLKKGLHAPGTIYVVSGSAGKLGGQQTDFPHRAMIYSDADHGGASFLEFNGDQLIFKWVCADGKIRDQFEIKKEK